MFLKPTKLKRIWNLVSYDLYTLHTYSIIYDLQTIKVVKDNKYYSLIHNNKSKINKT